MDHDPVITLHEYQPYIEVQVTDIKYDIMVNQFKVTISDSYHSLVATLDREMNFNINHKKMEFYDIIQIKQTSGHPSKNLFNLVNILFLETSKHWKSSALIKRN